MVTFSKIRSITPDEYQDLIILAGRIKKGMTRKISLRQATIHTLDLTIKFFFQEIGPGWGNDIVMVDLAKNRFQAEDLGCLRACLSNFPNMEYLDLMPRSIQHDTLEPRLAILDQDGNWVQTLEQFKARIGTGLRLTWVQLPNLKILR